MEKTVVDFAGKVVKKVFSGENDFKIYAMDVDTTKYKDVKTNPYGNVSITGQMIDLDYDVEYKIVAEEKNTKFGLSYSIISIRRDMPTSEKDIYAFLSSVLTQSQADVLYKVYPDIIDRIKNNEPVDLSKTKGIKEFTFNKIRKKVLDNFTLIDVIAKYKDVFSYNIIQKLYQQYGSVELIDKKLHDNPYECLCSISRVGFIKADDMILKLEIESKKAIDSGNTPVVDFGFNIKTSYERCLFCILYILEKNEEDGNTYITLKNIFNEVSNRAKECMSHLAECLDDPQIYFNRDAMIVALSETYEKEKYIAETLSNAMLAENKYNIIGIDKYRYVNGHELSNEQYSTLKTICNNNVVILNGFAGSGKSFTTTAILNMLDDNNKSYVLFAPTGKAAKVLKEYTKREASTIHKGLGCKGLGKWEYNKDNKLIVDVVIVDEFSMVDISLCVHLLDAIDFSKTKLLMIGDSAQLPSVGCGNILHDLLCSNKIPNVTLHHIFRYNEGGLMTVATDIRHCKKYLKPSNDSIIKFGDGSYYFININQESIIKTLVNLYARLLKKNKVADIQVLSAYRIGDFGSDILNQYLQKIANSNSKNGTPIKIGEKNFYVGDVVIQTVNNYNAKPLVNDTDILQSVFIANGESGVIKRIENDNAIINFDGVDIIYSREEMGNIDLGYCTTVHKSQGSSSKYVIFVSPKAHTYMLNSNLMYVAVTRTKQMCIHIGGINTVNYCVTKKEDYTRATMLNEILNKNN